MSDEHIAEIPSADAPDRQQGAPERNSARTAGAPLESEPTFISRRPALLPTESPFTESAYRILEGRIMVGDRLGHYELAEYIGGGGMGRVFRAYDERLAREVAVKVLAPEQAGDAETRLRFQIEAQSAARLDHENIARVYYVGEERGLQFIVFEFIDGVNMRELVERVGPLPIADVVSYTLQVSEALAHAAARDVVHRDIKPSNLLITSAGQVKLIDMGLARLHRVSTEGELTASGVTLGTFDYISPEQARDPRHADVRSDIYSLGCTLFYMLTGKPPFPEGTVLQKLLRHQSEMPVDVRQLRPETPEELSRILRKMLAKDPRHRYPTPAALIDDLWQVAALVGLPSEDRRPRTTASRAARFGLLRHLPWALPLALLLASAAAIELSSTSPRSRTLPPASTGKPAATTRDARVKIDDAKAVAPTDASRTKAASR